MSNYEETVVVCGLCERWNAEKWQNEFLIARRDDQADYSGCWEFPGGKLEEEDEEMHHVCLGREWEEEFGVKIEPGERLGELVLQNRRGELFRILLYAVALTRDQVPQLRVHTEIRYCTLPEILALPLSDAVPSLHPFTRHLLAF